MLRVQTEEPGCTDPISCAEGIIGGIGDAVDGATEAVGFWTDPWGNTFKTMQEAAHGLAHDVLPFLTEATTPDLTADWFLQAYAVSFALSLFVFAVLLLSLFVKAGRNQISGEELSESLTVFVPLFIAGSMFGPMAGWVLGRFFHALSESVAGWAIEGSVDGIVGELQSMIDEVDPAGIVGGVVIAVVLMICMVIALFLVMLVLLVQLVTLYFVGTIVPLALVWMIDPARRSIAWRVLGVWVGLMAAHPLLFLLLGVWVGLMAAHPLLFLLLGVAFTMTAASAGTFGDPSLTAVVQLIVSIVSLFMAALSPLVLMKFAPVLGAPSGASAASVPQPSGNWGAKNPHEALDRYRSSDLNGPQRTEYASPQLVREEGPSVPPTRSTLADAASAAPGAGAAGAGAAGAGAATGAAEGMAAAGAAESATGAGAAIGVPTLLAAGAVAAGDAAGKAAEKAGGYSLAAMDEVENQQ